MPTRPARNRHTSSLAAPSTGGALTSSPCRMGGRAKSRWSRLAKTFYVGHTDPAAARRHPGDGGVDRRTVRSRSVASAGYDERSRTLEVEFTNGSVYQYSDVPLGVYE